MLLIQGRTKLENVFGAYITQLAVGSGNGAVTGNETALTNQAKVLVTGFQVDYPSSGYVTFSATVDDSVPPMTIQEVGLMDAGGSLLYRALVTPTAKVNGQSVNISYKIKVQ